MRKGSLKNVGVYISAIIIVFLVTGASAVGEKPGSVADPLVSKSYVDKKIDEMINLIGTSKSGSQNVSAELIEKIDEIVALKIDEKVDLDKKLVEFEGLMKLKLDEFNNTNTLKFVPVGPVKAGSKLFGEQGTEVILRSGSATALCPGENGLQNVTNGTDIPNNKDVPKNNLVIIPRKDGRGIQVNQDAWFMVRGGYTVE